MVITRAYGYETVAGSIHLPHVKWITLVITDGVLSPAHRIALHSQCTCMQTTNAYLREMPMKRARRSYVLK